MAINQKTLRSYHRVVSEHKEVMKLSSLLSSSINSTKRLVTTAMEQFYTHKYLWMEERNDVIGQFLAEERTVGDFQEQMQKYRNLSEMLNSEPDVVTVGPLSLHCGKRHHNMLYVHVQIIRVHFHNLNSNWLNYCSSYSTYVSIKS